MKTIYRKNFGVCALLCAAMLSSCASDELQDMSVTDEAIRFSTVISDNAATRAVDATWEDNDEVGVFMYPSTVTGNPTDGNVLGKKNAKYIASTSDGGVTCTLNAADATNKLYYPIAGDVKFIAYYPYDGTNINELSSTYTVTLDAQNATKGFDLLYYKDDSKTFNKKTTTTPALVFEHQLSKIIINVMRSTEVGGATDVVLTNMKITLTGTPKEAKFDLSTGALSDQATAAEVTTVVTTTTDTWERTHQAIIIPHVGTTDYNGTTFANRKLEFDYDDDGTADADYSIPNDKAFAKGKAHSYNFTITGTEVVFNSVTITDWDILSTPENNGAGEDVIN